jgi:outer membrane protein TolC
MVGCRRILIVVVCALIAALTGRCARGQGIVGTVFAEQRRMQIRDPSQLPRVRLPDVPTPPSVSHPLERQRLPLSLDNAIRIALENSEVVRVLTGAGATSSGSTIYDPAITNTQVDQARARFDPNLQVLNDFDQIDRPGAADVRQNPADPPDVRILGRRTDQYNLDLGLSKTTVSGGTASLNVHANSARSPAELLNPEASSSVDMSFTQPLLQGGGIRANLAPIEIARIDTERSFYQLKGSVQQLIRGVIEAYWALVFARVDVWARQQQVEQGERAMRRAEVLFRGPQGRIGGSKAGDRAQARSSLAGFRANLVTAKADQLRREAALRNILGMPPSDGQEIVPVTAPATEWIDVEWEAILRTAERYRPDLIERKLIIESDQQQLLLARNEAFPQVDAGALYRWDALGGRGPGGAWLGSRPGQFTGWNLGIDVSVPLGLRRARAALRQQELTLMRDRASLEQALHNATHLLAESYRNLAQFYSEYDAYSENRRAARVNLDLQLVEYDSGRIDYLDVLVAITGWGNAIDSEARALLQYDTELANLQEQTGTILEDHGIRFVEEPYCSIGPLGRLVSGRWYPKGRRPGPNDAEYGGGDQPAERVFELEEPEIPGRGERDRPLPRIPPMREIPPDDLVPPSPGIEQFPRPAPAAEMMSPPGPATKPEEVPLPKPDLAPPGRTPESLLEPIPGIDQLPRPAPALPLGPLPGRNETDNGTGPIRQR